MSRLRELVDLEWQTLGVAMREAAPRAHGRLLDVGCGDKPWAALFAALVSEYVGLEYEETHGAAARSAADVTYLGDRMPFDDESFDTVLSNQVLEHVPDPRALLAEMVRVLAPGGTLILTVPFSFRLHFEPHDYWRFTSHGLRALCAEQGLEIEVLRARGGLARVLGHKVATWLAFSAGRLEGAAQRGGAMGYDEQATVRPRYWALPLVIPALLVVTTLAAALDRPRGEPLDTLGYLLIARK